LQSLTHQPRAVLKLTVTRIEDALSTCETGSRSKRVTPPDGHSHNWIIVRVLRRQRISVCRRRCARGASALCPSFRAPGSEVRLRRTLRRRTSRTTALEWILPLEPSSISVTQRKVLHGESDHDDAKGVDRTPALRHFFSISIPGRNPYGFCCVEGDATWGDGSAAGDGSALLLPCRTICGGGASDLTAGRITAS
jgi:hypothetical protein